jgi:1-acyl-sn-glycerol-3-phosphate acyltransferase
MRALVGVWRLARLLPHIAGGLWVVARRFKRCSPAERHGHIQAWSRRLLEIFGVTLEVRGEVPASLAGHLVVANHVSWLDIAAIHAVLPQVRFVSKADVKHWPVVGLLVEGVGTLFIERASKRDAMRVVHQTADALKAGDAVAVFPEGTTGHGPELLPFHANLLQAAVSIEAPVQPVLLRWHEPGERFSASAAFVGDTTLVQSLWRVVTARGLGVVVTVLPAQPSSAQDRRALAQALELGLRQALAAD